MSGGVLSEYGSYTFVKVVYDDDGEQRPYWFISEFEVREGDKVLAPFGIGGQKTATVVKVENNVSGQVAPIPVKRARKLIKPIEN